MIYHYGDPWLPSVFLIFIVVDQIYLKLDIDLSGQSTNLYFKKDNIEKNLVVKSSSHTKGI